MKLSLLLIILGVVSYGKCLEDIFVIDGHNDMPYRIRHMVGFKLDKFDFAKNLTDDPIWGVEACKECHTDLPRLKAGKVRGTFWSLYSDCTTASYKDATEHLVEQIDLALRFIEKYPNDLQLATSAKDITDAFKNGKIASLLGIEGGHAIDSRLSVLRVFYRMGVRYMSLTHDCNTAWADASTSDGDPSIPNKGGLTDFGKKIVLEMNRIGMMVDLAHVSEAVMEQALDIALAPVIFSHSVSYTVFQHHRNVKDHILLKLKKNDGIIMANFYPPYLAKPGTNSTIKDVTNHINHIVDLIGHDNIGLGCDFDATEKTTVGLEDVSKYPKLFEALHAENPTRWTVENLQKLGHKNLIRVMGNIEKARDNLVHMKVDEDVIPMADLEYEDKLMKGVVRNCRSDMKPLETKSSNLLGKLLVPDLCDCKPGL